VKKKFLSILLIMIMCMSVFTGCSLVEPNDKNYYESVVATIEYTDGEKENITRREFALAYNSYGYNYVQNQGMTQEEAFKETVESIIDNRVTMKEVESYYEAIGEDLFTPNETTYLWDTTYSSLFENLRSYFLKVIDHNESEAGEEEAVQEASVYKEYTSSISLKENSNGGYDIIKKSTPANIRSDYEARKNANDVYVDLEYKNAEGKYVFQEEMYDKLMSLTKASTNIESARNWQSAVNDYLKDVKENYSYMEFSTDKEWMLFEIDRVYDILRDNYVVQKYEEIYNRANHKDSNISAITVNDILSVYTKNVLTDYATYISKGDLSTFQTDMLSDFANVNYIVETKDLRETKASDYFSVGYIKLEFNAYQKLEYSIWNTKKETESCENEDYENAMNNLYNGVYTYVRDSETGEKTTQKAYAYGSNGLLAEISDKLDDYQYVSEEGDLVGENKRIAYLKAEAFRDYLYRYNDDDTLKGAETNTVFGVDKDGNVLANDTFKDNENVTTAIKKLYNNGNARIGDLSEIVRSEDGIYIFFYAGDVENHFVGIDESFNLAKNEKNITVLSSTRVNIFSNKTILDVLFESLQADNFSVYKNMDINNLRQHWTKGDIKIIENNLKLL